MDRAKEAAIAVHACVQHGLVTRAQLIEVGLDRSTVRRRVAAGALVALGAGTYRLASAPPTPRSALLAGCLDRSGTASHRAGTWLHGHMPPPPVLELTVPKGRPQRRLFIDGYEVVVRASTNLPDDDIVTVDGIPATSLARSLLGVAALVPTEVTFDELVDVVAATIEAGDASMAWLRWVLEQRRCRGRNGVTALEAALDARERQGPTESWLEREYLAAAAAVGLPRPELQRRIPRRRGAPARVDFLHRPEGVVVEVMGYAFHRTPEQMDSDTMRANELQLQGLLVVQVTARRLRRDPGSVMDLVAAALASRSRGSVSF